jgi:hypothetical protein
MNTLEDQKLRLLREMQQEYRPDFILPIHFGLMELLSLVANLQLALRHPGNTGQSEQTAREIIAAVIERVEAAGFRAHAVAMRLGDDPLWDDGRPQ